MIKTYEGFFSNNKKKDIQIKLAQAFVNLFSNINPNIVSHYETRISNKNLICIYVDNTKLLHIGCDMKLFNESEFIIELFFEKIRFFDVEIPDNVEDFIKSIFYEDSKYKRFDDSSFTIKEKQIPEIISKLTIENYNIFSNTEKYNL